MKTVANVNELKRLAIARGATASVGGSTINSQGSRLRVVTPQARPQVEPEPEPQLPDPLSQAVDRMGAMLSDAIGKLQPTAAPAMPTQPQVYTMPEKPAPRMWSYRIEQTPDGLIGSVLATSGDSSVRFTVMRDDEQRATSITAERL